MTFLFDILRRAAADMAQPRVLAVMLLPMLGALVLWGGLFWLFGAGWVAATHGFVAGVPLPEWLNPALAGWLLGFAAWALLAVLLLPAIYVTALLITSLVLMPMLVGVVAARHHPGLARLQGGGFVGSVGNGVYAIVVYLLLWLLTLPFWLLGPLGLAISLLLNAWLNQRLFLYDALAEHASAAEIARLRVEAGWRLYLLALLLGLLFYVPLLNIFAPVYMGLAFTHYALDTLAKLREEHVA